jgi:hypothetical protein
MALATASSTAQTLRAGYAKADVTPAMPVYMAGYDLRNAPSDGMHGSDRLYARVLIFDDGAARVAFVVSDVIGTREPGIWRAKIAQVAGLPVENVLLGDVHNHAAPSPTPKYETDWDRQFEKGLLAAAAEAVRNLQAVRIAAGAGVSRIAMNRRQVRAKDSLSPLGFDENARSQFFGKYETANPQPIREFAGVVRLGANPSGPIDESVQLVRIDTGSGTPFALMIHYACHGTSLGGRNSKISGEWMGRMQEFVEKQFAGLGSIYLPGAAGDINPRVVGGLDGDRDDINATWALGEEIGREVARVYRALSPEPAAGARIRIVRETILLPRNYRELFDDFRNTAVEVPTTVVRIGDLMWVTFPGELFHAIGKAVRAAAPTPFAHIMGYTNEYIGYFPEQKAYSEGGYEVAVTHLDPVSEGIYLRAVADLMRRLD